MRALAVAASTLILIGCATTSSTTAEYDAAAEASLRAKVDQIFRDLAASKLEVMKAEAPETIVFDFDDQNKPMSAYTPAEWNKIVDGYLAALKQGLTMETKVGRVEVHATSNFGYATVEFDQWFTMGGEKMGPAKFRGTLVARRKGNDWVWTHWHGSFREFPATPEKE